MGDTKMTSTTLKSLPEIRRGEASDQFHNWLRAIPCECHAFEFTNELLLRQFNSAINRILRLKNLEQDCYKDGDSELAASYRSRSLEVKRRFAKLVRDAVELLSDNGVLAEDIVCDADDLISEVVNELRLMGE
jgi:hypothetical protein